MITYYKTDFGLAEIDDDYMKAVINEGITVTPDDNNTLLEMVENHFKNKHFVYITHRVYSYSIDPRVYLETTKIKTLVGLAVVSDNPIQIHQTQIENTFSNEEFRHFYEIEDALKWKEELLRK